MWSWLLLAWSLIPSTLGQASFTYYFLLLPAEVYHPSTEKAYVHVSGVRETLTLTITLQTEGQDTILYQQLLAGPSLFQCIDFQTPPPAGGTDEVATIHISLVGPSTEISESKNILISSMGLETLIQTDKPIYKPGQTVHFRVLSFDEDFMAIDDKCPLVELQDPKWNRVGQWLNLTPQQGIIDLSFTLDSEAALGTYTIKAPNGKQTFHVSEYVLPTFEVIPLLPSVVTILDEALQLKICGRYTFGKPVQGEVYARLCRRVVKYYWYSVGRPEDLCGDYRGRTDKTGCLVLEIPTALYELRSYNYQMSIEVKTSLVEDMTGVQINATSSCRISAMIAKVTFDEAEFSDFHYKPGLKYKGVVKLVSADGSPMKSKRVYLTEEYNRVTTERVYETDENGQASFTLDTKIWNGKMVILTASYQKENMEFIYGELNPYFPDAHRSLQPFNSITNSFLKIQPKDQPLSCDQEYQLEIDYIIRGSELIDGRDYLEFHYVVMSRGNIVRNGQLGINISRNSVMMDTLKLPLLVTADIAPMAHVLVYTILSSGRISADTEQFPVNKCFNNNVTLDFSKREGLPGSKVSLDVRASPGSLCALRAVDESVYFMRPEAELSSDTLYSLITWRNQYGYPYEVQEVEPRCWSPYIGHQFRNWVPPSSPDVFTLIKRMGLKILTNTLVKKVQKCQFHPPVAALSEFGYNKYIGRDSDFDTQSSLMVDEPYNSLPHVTATLAEVSKKIRKNFPETWIWDLVPVGTSGQAALEMKIPDTITEWKAMMFCMGDVGLGLSPTASLRAFQPFFVELILPYSIVRGESFTLKASVFNYQSVNMMVQVTLWDSVEMQVVKCSNCSYTQCLFADESKVFTWDVRALQLGTVQIVISTEAIKTEVRCGGEKTVVPEDGASDTLIRTILVKAEGMPVETSQNSLLCAGGNLSSETISISLPPDVVPDSATAVISIVVDLIGTALDGIERLLNLPCGCGEQNMVRFAPNIYVLRYLERSNQLTGAIKAKGEEYLKLGYQRQMNYQRKDGSYSAFGERDKEGNTWLTAFVMKSFSSASHYISVDEKHLHEAASWLKENQLPNGCFKCRGKLFKTTLKGGVNDDISLSTYVTIALLEMKWPQEDAMLQNALQCLRSFVPLVDSQYTQALLAYTFTLSKDQERRDTLLRGLYDKAERAGGQVYWPQTPKHLTNVSSWSQPNSFEVELASYIVLSHLSMETPTKEDIIKASSVALWITSQQNAHGGFISTQDTVVALQALSRYAEVTHTEHAGLQVTVSPSEGEGAQHHLWVDHSTRFLLQKRRLYNLPGNYTAVVKGDGCVYLQTTLRYNIHPAKTSPTFDLQLNTSEEGCGGQSASCFNLTICVRYTGLRPVTNMALIEVAVLSGFSVLFETVKKLEKHSLVKRTEMKEDEVVIYLAELSHKNQCFSFLARQDIRVGNLEAQLVKVYDYYDPEEKAEAMYNLPSQ